MAAVAKAIDKREAALETSAANSLTDSWSLTSGPYQTRLDEQSLERSSSLTLREPELITRSVLNRPAAVIEAPQTPVAEMRFDMEGGIRRIDAVVGEIKPDTVVVNCQLATGRVQISLPSALIPVELLSFGMPIQISLDSSSGVRIPLVERREIKEQSKLPGQQEIENWIDKL